MREVLTAVLVLLVAVNAGWYVAALRCWMRRLKDPDVRALDERQHAEFIASPEYGRLRRSVRRPIYAAVVLTAALFVVLRIPL